MLFLILSGYNYYKIVENQLFKYYLLLTIMVREKEGLGFRFYIIYLLMFTLVNHILVRIRGKEG